VGAQRRAAQPLAPISAVARASAAAQQAGAQQAQQLVAI
jgi:hypothetical protein